MGCCRKSPKKTSLLQQAAAKRVVGARLPQQGTPRIDRRGKLTSTSPNSILCKHFETKGGDLLVNVTPERKIMFQASGSTFDLEENIELYGCSGKVATLMKVIRKKLNALTVAPTSTQIKLSGLLALLIDMVKKEA